MGNGVSDIAEARTAEVGVIHDALEYSDGYAWIDCRVYWISRPVMSFQMKYGFVGWITKILVGG